MITIDEIRFAMLLLKDSHVKHPATSKKIAESLKTYEGRGEYDGTIESAVNCLKLAEYEIADLDALNEFLTAYRSNLVRARRFYPDQYSWSDSEFFDVFERMSKAIERGSFNKDSHAFKWTCKELGIKHTYTAISNFLKGNGK